MSQQGGTIQEELQSESSAELALRACLYGAELLGKT